ncbi:phage portal protein [Parasedimentitalea huanghaiensis]|uniref:Phage portal protein n=1 Tax=Parasedimentitalea huanghaiensis TaxID=2682100 RepID=A0A6L6WAJ2_9RHOB|nr:phage portal protein [Zongyanglinia huanghaiensis]MVO14816.1 phage portal protein [Zongyanglinia huanghaiensis]
MGGFLSYVAPEMALRREIARTKLDLLRSRRVDRQASAGSYAPVGGGRRSQEFYRNGRDAQGAMQGARMPLAFIARDMLRNNPRVVRANNLFSGYAIGAGIRPVVEMVSAEASQNKKRIEGLIEDHLLTTAIDADGNSTLFGLQSLSMKTIPTSGEVLLRRRLRRSKDGLPLPFQIQCLETDYLTTNRDTGQGTNGRRIEDGIEYGPTGKSEFFHLHTEHPGSVYGGGNVRRVAAEHIAHAFMVDRPGQKRGISWYTPVMPELMDIHKFMQGTLKRQEVAAMFAGILRRVGSDDDPDGDSSDFLSEIEAGGILELDAGDELDWNEPPSAMDAEPVVRLIDRLIASGLMLTYEGFTGDYSRVNYSSGRMGRMDQDPIVSFWQQELMIAKQMSRVGDWFKEAVHFKTGIDPTEYRLKWTAPRRPVVDPTKDYPALNKKVRSGFASRQSVIREAGEDPARVQREIEEDNANADDSDAVFDSDPRKTTASGAQHSNTDSKETADE